MVDRPILFSGDMIRALLHGRKTQARRDIAKGVKWDYLWELEEAKSGDDLKHLPCIHVGDVLWVRERFAYKHAIPEDKARDKRWYGVVYEADGDPTGFGISDLKPAIFMPRWASRITLIVTDVRVERLQDISEGDALAEGIERCHFPERGDWGWPQKRYRDLWDAINGAGAWEENPWVAACTFTVIKQNIDQIDRAA